MGEAGDGIGSLATGALWARTVEPEHGVLADGHDADGGACANCGTKRVGAYCHVCGQMGHIHKNVAALVHDIAHGVFHFEGKLWSTLPLLAWHPGRLTRRYVDGERAKFVSPMALFLFSVFLMFAVVSNIPTGSAETKDAVSEGIRKDAAADAAKDFDAATNKLAALKVEQAKAGTAAARAALAEQVKAAKDEVRALSLAASASAIIQNPKATRDRVVHLNTGWSWFDRSVAHMSANPELTLYKIKTYGYKYSWALVPISMPFIWLLFAFRRDVGLYDHAIFSIYSLSFMSLGVVVLTVLGWLGLGGGIIALTAMLIPPVHMYRQLKGAYGLGRWAASWRMVALLIITSITSSIFISFLFWMGSD